MKVRLVSLGCVVALAGAVMPAMASDVGDPIFPVDMKNKARAELIYENVQRDLNVDGGPVSKLKADVVLLRMHTDVGQYTYLDFDAGYMDPSGGDGGFYGGVGLRNLIYDTPDWRVAAHVQGHYAWDLSDEDTSYNFWDVDGGATLSRKIKIDNQLTILPYAGPVLSIVRLDGDNNLSADEDNVLGAAVGVSLLMREMNTIRVEGRYFDDFSISAAAGIAF